MPATETNPGGGVFRGTIAIRIRVGVLRCNRVLAWVSDGLPRPDGFPLRTVTRDNKWLLDTYRRLTPEYLFPALPTTSAPTTATPEPRADHVPSKDSVQCYNRAGCPCGSCLS